MTNGRALRTLAWAAAVVGVASCDLSTQPGGLYSISRLLLPSPGLVVGDTMRDSTGAAADLRVLGFSIAGDSVPGTAPYFITLDTLAHLSGGAKLIGDVVGKARVIGGIGNLQTLPESVTVTLSPDTLVPADSVRFVKTYSLLSADVTSGELASLVQHKVVGGANTAVDAVVVKYALLYSPPAQGALPTVEIVNGNFASARDTTANGRAGRAVRMYLARRANVAVDSAIVQASASYRGVSIGTVTFTVIFQSQ